MGANSKELLRHNPKFVKTKKIKAFKAIMTEACGAVMQRENIFYLNVPILISISQFCLPMITIIDKLKSDRSARLGGEFARPKVIIIICHQSSCRYVYVILLYYALCSFV